MSDADDHRTLTDTIAGMPADLRLGLDDAWRSFESHAVDKPTFATGSGPTSKDFANEVARLEEIGVAYQDAVLVLSPKFLKVTPAIGFVQEFMAECSQMTEHGANAKTFCVLAGPLGTGKTVAASYVLAHGRPPRTVGSWRSHEQPLFRHVGNLTSSCTLLGDADAREREVLRRAKILVVDDLGAEEDRRGFHPYLDWLINARYGASGWTVLTTNLPMESFRHRYGERIYDRLKHRVLWFDLDHDSLRG